MTKLKALLTLDEAATYLAVSKTTLRRWTNDGRLACHRVGPRNERRFTPDVLHMFVSSGGSETPELRAPTISWALFDSGLHVDGMLLEGRGEALSGKTHTGKNNCARR
jgi:excisionase family DNA binding protein